MIVKSVSDRWLKPDYVSAYPKDLNITRIENVWAGSFWTMALGYSKKEKRNILLAWGVNAMGQLGVERTHEKDNVIALPRAATKLDRVLPKGSEWVSVAGDTHVLGVTSCGKEKFF